MMASVALDPALESLLAFWAEAGVDAAVEDEPVDRLQRPAPARIVPAAAAQAAVPPALGAAGVRGDLAAAIAEARRFAAGAADLPDLLAAAASFDPGPFRPAGARRTALLRGDAPADVVVIGGAPGADEDEVGTAFAGAEGRLLDRMLAAAGLGGRALLAHAVLWRTPGDRPPTPEEAALSRPFLERAVALAAPKALLLLGDAPARLVLGREEGVLKLRREALTWSPEGDGTALPAHVTFGPGFLLRQSQAKKRAWDDLLSLNQRVVGA